MKVTLTKEEAEEIFFNSLCNTVGTGYMEGYGLCWGEERDAYAAAREALRTRWNTAINPPVICIEDIYMEMLRQGGTLTLRDEEGEGEYTRSITLADVHARVPEVGAEVLLNFLSEEDDIEDADAVIQTVFFEEVIFG